MKRILSLAAAIMLISCISISAAAEGAGGAEIGENPPAAENPVENPPAVEDPPPSSEENPASPSSEQNPDPEATDPLEPISPIEPIDPDPENPDPENPGNDYTQTTPAPVYQQPVFPSGDVITPPPVEYTAPPTEGEQEGNPTAANQDDIYDFTTTPESTTTGEAVAGVTSNDDGNGLSMGFLIAMGVLTAGGAVAATFAIRAAHINKIYRY